MREFIKMVLVLTVLTALSGGLLAGLKAKTEDRIELQVLNFVKKPVLKELFADAENDMVADRFTIIREEEELTVFPVKRSGSYQEVAFSASGKGYGGDVGIMVGVNISSDKISGVRVTTHSETPGIGARAKSNPELLMPEFVGLPMDKTFTVKTAGGEIDAISGATITSKAVCGGVTAAGKIYQQHKDEIKAQLKAL